MTTFVNTFARSLEWLLASDEPSVRHLVLRDLLDRPADDPDLLAACAEAHQRGAIPLVLDAMQPEGYWEKPGPGYSPKYKSIVWSLQLLAQLGAQVDGDARVRTACVYYLDHAFTPGGRIGYNGAPGGTFDCLQGNMLWALTRLGYDDPRMDAAVAWMARSNLGEGVASKTEKDNPDRYYTHKSGPEFRCGENYDQPCSWGAAKVLLAFSALPAAQRTPLVERAITQAVEYFFSAPPETALWPSHAAGHPSRNWWKLGFPLYYISDLLQVAEGLAGVGRINDPRAAGLVNWLRGKADADGRWPLEYHYGSKTWGRYGRGGQPNPWVTIRALRVLKAVES